MGLPFPFQLARINTDGQVLFSPLAAADPLPAGAQYAGGVAFSGDGEVYVSDGSDAPADAQARGGLLFRADGVLFVQSVPSGVTQQIQAYTTGETGRLFVSIDTPANYQNGVPFDSDGYVCGSAL